MHVTPLLDGRSGARRIGAGHGTLLTRVTMSRALAGVLIAQGRDTADAALTVTFGINQLESFKVRTDKISDARTR